MLIEILKHVPIWVYFLFAALVRLGWVLHRDRQVSLARGVMVPLLMSGLSVFGVISAFHGSPIPIAAWAVGLLFVLGLCVLIGYPRGVSLVAEGKVFLPGSWVPLALMMTIFFVKFGVGVALAQQPGLAQVAGFSGGVSLIYGAVSGAFLVRALAVLRAFWKTPATEALAGA